MRENNLEKFLKALANRRRIAIVRFLKKRKEAPVGDISKEIKISFRATSRHLNVLASADILEKEQRNVQVFYRINNNLLKAMNHVLSII